MTSGPEWTKVEEPFLDRLEQLGWKTVIGSLDHASVSGRQHFRQVLLVADLSRALKRINLRDGKPWLDDARVGQAIAALDRITKPRLMEANQEATRALLEGCTVPGLPEWDQGRDQTLRFIDWDNPDNNDYVAISQFKVECPGGVGKGSIRPDITLFVNGIPLVVIECKSPTVSSPMVDAVDQLRRYHNARKDAGEIDENEGAERLFYTNQFLVATYYDEARFGTIGASLNHYLEWKDTAPVPLAEAAAQFNRSALSSQDTLIAGMLRPAHLLDIIRHFTIFTQIDGRTIKVVCRYQQFRAVHYAMQRLLTGKTKAEDGEHDKRGGLIWHTQGSGKSLTMVFLVRKMRSDETLRKFKIVVVTDRTDLQRQLSETAALTGEVVRVGRSVKEVRKLLARKAPELVFAMIQKYVSRDLDELTADAKVSDLGHLNDSPAILVLVDEAHRSHTNSLHAALLQALPNCARIGFTGTPIIMGAKRRTTEIFGEFIDRYTIKQAEDDGATVPILYEGRYAKGAVLDGQGLDESLAQMFPDYSQAQREVLKRKHGTLQAILEAEEVIAEKAGDILRHYVSFILPNGLKAQLVAVSRRAAVRYQAALVEVQAKLIAEAEALDAATRELDDVELALERKSVQAAVRAWRQLGRLRKLEFAAVISAGSHNEPPEFHPWTEPGPMEQRIRDFKKPFEHKDPEKASPLAFLLVKSMLLTGFDAPIEGVLYLDRPIREAELLQAIARVNRTGYGKTAGIVVDYYGIGKDLADALSEYTAEDIEGAWKSFADEIPKLRDRHDRVMGIFLSRDADPMQDLEGAIEVLRDERVRAEFVVKFKQFMATLDLVLPQPEALPFVPASKVLGELYTRARNLYREGMPPLDKGVGRKVQQLIDKHVISLGIDPRIPPIAITDANFGQHVSKQVSARAKASEMEHAVRHHIKKRLDEDPVHYQRLSDRLEAILIKYKDNWEQLVLELAKFVEEVRKGRSHGETPLGLDPALHAPFFDLLVEARQAHGPVSQVDKQWLAELTLDLVERVIGDEVRNVGFWANVVRQEELHSKLFMFLDENEVVELEEAEGLAQRLLELAKANHEKLVKQG